MRDVKRVSMLALVLALCAMLALAGCAPADTAPGTDAPADASGEQGDVIKIGVLEPITGANAGGGAIELEGMKLANQLYPEVLGKKVELVVADNKSDKVEAATAAQRLVEKDKVAAVIGSWGSGFSIAAGPIFEKAGVPAVGASCTSPLVTEGNDYYFRVCFIDPYQGKVMANYAYKELGARKAAIVREISNDYSVGLAKFFEDAFKELTGDPDCIVATAEYNTGDQDFNAQVTNLAQAKPDVVFAPGNFTESAMIIKQARIQGIDVPFLGGDTWETPEFLSVGGSEVEGAILSTFFDESAKLSNETQVFLDAYYKSHEGEENPPAPAAVTALGYDAYRLVLDAIERAGTTEGKALRDAIAATDGFDGAAGAITLDENGDAIKPAVIKEVKDGKFTYMTTVDATGK